MKGSYLAEAGVPTMGYEQGPSHSFLFDVDPPDPRSHVPSLCERGGQRILLPEAPPNMSTVHRDVD